MTLILISSSFFINKSVISLTVPDNTLYLSDTDILELWEVIWTCPYNTDYCLFIATAILLQERDSILSEEMSFSQILKVRYYAFEWLYFWKFAV